MKPACINKKFPVNVPFEDRKHGDRELLTSTMQVHQSLAAWPCGTCTRRHGQGQPYSMYLGVMYLFRVMYLMSSV